MVWSYRDESIYVKGLISREVKAEMNFINKVFARLRMAARTLISINVKFDEVKINQGAILAFLHRQKTSKNLPDYEFKIFSQWGEDGIIQYLTRAIEIKNKTFIEFGVEDFSESNCRFLLMKDDWKGFVIDGSLRNMVRLKNSYFYWRHHLVARQAFITRENINALLEESGFDKDLGIMSIDLDGIDYFVFEVIETYRPRILVIEFNSVFGLDRKISVPYRADFCRSKAHHSNLYFGASLAALAYLGDQKGYALVGTNTAGVNAFFVREDLLSERIERRTVAEVYHPSNCRESLDEFGDNTYLTANDRLEAIKGLPVLNVETGQLEVI